MVVKADSHPASPGMLAGVFGIKTALKRRLALATGPKMIVGYQGKRRTRISSSVVFHGDPKNIHIADNVFVWHHSILDGTDDLTIEEGVQIGAWVGLFTHSSHIAIRLMGDRYGDWHDGERPGWIQEPLRIGAYSFVGAKSSVLPGCHIGRAALISAHSLVTKPIPDYAMVAGAPAKVIGDVRQMDRKYIDEISKFWGDYQAALNDHGRYSK